MKYYRIANYEGTDDFYYCRAENVKNALDKFGLDKTTKPMVRVISKMHYESIKPTYGVHKK